MELLVQPYTLPKEILFNFEELKTALTEKVREYETAIYSEDQIKQAKADKASLNKLKKAINDERIRMEREYMTPFTEFKGKISEIISIIDKPIAAIDEQVKAYDEKRQTEKAAEVQKYLEGFSLPYGINLMKRFNPKWLNASASMASVKKEIDEAVIGIQDDLETLETVEEEYLDFAIGYYRETLDLRATLTEIKRQKEFREQQKKIAEERQKKAEEAKKPEAVKAPEPPKVEPKAEQPQEGQWVAFQAYLTPEKALKLKRFFAENGINFKPITEG